MQMNAQVNMQMDAGQGWSVNPRNGVQQAKQDMSRNGKVTKCSEDNKERYYL